MQFSDPTSTQGSWMTDYIVKHLQQKYKKYIAMEHPSCQMTAEFPTRKMLFRYKFMNTCTSQIASDILYSH